MGNKPSTTTQTTQQTRSPWAPAVAPLTGIVNRADQLGQDVSNFTPIYSGTTQQGAQNLADAAGNVGMARDAFGAILPGSTAGFNTGLGQLTSTANGAYINANPYLDAALGRSLNDTATRVNSQFTGAGRYGSGAHTQTLARNLGEIEAQARLSNYNTERSNQDAAARTLYGGGFQGAAMGSAADQAQLAPALAQLQAGGIFDQMANAQRLAPMQGVEWANNQIRPIAGLGGDSSGTSTSQTQQPTNWLTTGLGLGMGLLTAPMTGGSSLMGTAANPTLMGSLTRYFP